MNSWHVVRKTWLTRKPSSAAWHIAVWSTALMFAGAFIYWQGSLNADSWMPASGETVFAQHQYWRLWTTLFAHGDFGHLISNTFLFVILGFFLSGYFGLFVFPLLAIAVGGLTTLIMISTYPPSIKLLGMSGVVYWMGAMWLVLYLLLDKQRSLPQRILRSMGVALGVFMPSAAFDPQISYGAHLVGFVLGVISALVYYLVRRKTFNAAIVTEEVFDEPEIRRPSRETEEATVVGHPIIYRTIRNREPFDDN